MKAMNNMGSSVVVGIASTKFLGVLVLAFAPSTLFRLYYFRMYMFIIVLGVFNGLFFLPVLLSLIGPLPVSFKFCFLIMCVGRKRYRGEGEQLIANDRGCEVGEIKGEINKNWRSSPYRHG